MPTGSFSRVNGIIFDLDGTLLDTLADVTAAANRVLTEYGFGTLTDAQMRPLVGAGLSELLAMAANTEDNELITKLVNGYRPYYAACMLERTRLYPGIADMLTALQRHNLPMAVLSNKPHEYTLPICDHYLARWPFVGILGHRPDVPRKPDPTAALELSDAMKREPETILFVGDSDVDIQTAQNAGMPSLAVTWGLRDRDHLQAASPDQIIDHADELPPLLGIDVHA